MIEANGHENRKKWEWWVSYVIIIEFANFAGLRRHCMSPEPVLGTAIPRFCKPVNIQKVGTRYQGQRQRLGSCHFRIEAESCSGREVQILEWTEMEGSNLTTEGRYESVNCSGMEWWNRILE